MIIIANGLHNNTMPRRLFVSHNVSNSAAGGKQDRMPYRLTLLTGALAAIAAATGLIWPGMYRDNTFVTAAWRGNDAVTLFVALPLLFAAMARARSGGLAARLVWLGALDYLMYNYAFYLFGAAFNRLFLLYCALFGLSAYAMLFAFLAIGEAGSSGAPAFPAIPAIPAAPGARRNRGMALAQGYAVFVAAGLSLIYVAQSLAFIVTGALPAIVERTGHPTSVVFALDLTLLVPALVLGALWTRRGNRWGPVLLGMSVVKGPLYTLVLTAGSWAAHGAGIPGASAEIPLWIVLTALGGIACAGFFHAIGDSVDLGDRRGRRKEA